MYGGPLVLFRSATIFGCGSIDELPSDGAESGCCWFDIGGVDVTGSTDDDCPAKNMKNKP